MKYFVLLTLSILCQHTHAQQDKRVARFVQGLDSIRTQLRIPGMAVAIKEGDTLLLERGLGYADLEHKTPVTPKTVFKVASITKTFTSTIIMQLVEQGKLNLDDPISKYGIDLGNPIITVRHLLTHTSEEIPGSHYQYNGNRFAMLTPILDQVSGMPYYQLLTENILIPLKMTSSVPFISLDQYYQYIRQNPAVHPYFDTAISALARPYSLYTGKLIQQQYQTQFGAFGGLATTVGDLLKYSDAVDQHRFISAKSQQQAFTQNRLNNGILSPYGLGWFVQHYEGIDFFWHYGQTDPGESALFVKAPQLKLTIAVLCNTDQLSQPFPLGDGDLFMSPVGQLLYQCFLLKDKAPSRDLGNKMLIDGATMALLNGDSLKAKQLYDQYAQSSQSSGVKFPKGKPIAGITEVGNNKDLSKSFTLPEPTRIHVFGIGEDCSGNGSYWCDFGWIEDSTGRVVWQMQNQAASPAGGAAKNQKVEQVMTLPAGKYTLRYKSDNGHSYNSWDSLPPDEFFWGIIVLTDR